MGGTDGFRVLVELANEDPVAFANAASRMLTDESAVNTLFVRMKAIAGPVAEPRTERRRDLYEAQRERGKKARACLFVEVRPARRVERDLGDHANE